jgi:hypothetical protein
MSVISGVDPGDLSGGHIKIGVQSHVGRNLGIILGALVLVAGIVGFTMYSNRQDAAMLSQLDSFRAAFAEKCDAEQFRGQPSQLVKDTYLRSSVLRDALAKQQAALQAGTPCDEVAHALKVADYPMPAPNP